jgi:hypothetical protein
MSHQIILNAEPVVSQFMRGMMGTPFGFTAGRGIAVVDDIPGMEMGRMLAGIWFESYTGTNMLMHVAAVPGSRWMSRYLLWYTFYYPFIEMGCKRVTGLVAETNYEARKFDERLGFKLEGRMKDGAPDGDILIYAMFRDECRWLGLAERMVSIKSRIN